MYIIGISAFYHDSAAALMLDGKIIAAAQEERFSRIKHDKSFPKKAIDFCLQEASIDIKSISLIVFYEKPFLKFDRIITTIQNNTPFGFSFFKNSLQSWVKTKLWIPSIISKELDYSGELIFSEHHESHAAGSFFSSPFHESAIITIDGVGEKACTTIGIGKANKVTILKEQNYPHSFGLLYSAFTQYCGFKVNSGEYKLMGLAPYGKPIFKELILKEIVTLSEKGEVQLNLKHFSFEKGNSTINKSFCEVFKNPQRNPEEKMSQFYCDIASSIQKVTEEFLIKISKYAKEITGLDNLCLSGGVALNCKSNGELLLENIFKQIWVQPGSGDAGGAIGACYIGWNNYLEKERVIVKDNLLNQAYLGTSYRSKQIISLLKKYDLVYHEMKDEEICDFISDKLNDKKIIGWFQGKMEFGPRALGNRSILASPLFEDMKSHINLKIKKREGFRPFAPIVIEEKAKDWFENIEKSKYMLFTYKGKNKAKIPSCIHDDDTARVQTLSKNDNPLLYKLISQFELKSGCPILINTSFNVRGEPIVESPFDALKCFFQTDMDYLVLGDFVVEKQENLTVDKELLKNANYELD